MISLVKFASALGNWAFLPQLKLALYVAAITAVVTYVGAWHFDKVADAELRGKNQQIAIYEEASRKQQKDITDASNKITRTVADNTIDDNLRMLDGSIIIVTDPSRSGSVLHSGVDSADNDTGGSPDAIQDEQAVHRLDNNSRPVAPSVQQKVHKSYPDSCYEIGYEELYGYVIVNHCFKKGVEPKD